MPRPTIPRFDDAEAAREGDAKAASAAAPPAAPWRRRLLFLAFACVTLALAGGLGGGLGSRGGTGTTPAPPTSSSASLALEGYTTATFTLPVRTAFVAGVASVLSEPAGAVTVTGVTGVGVILPAVGGRRHKLQQPVTEVEVTFSVATQNVSTISVLAKLNSSQASPDPDSSRAALEDLLQSAFTNAGMTALTNVRAALNVLSPSSPSPLFSPPPPQPPSLPPTSPPPPSPPPPNPSLLSPPPPSPPPPSPSPPSPPPPSFACSVANDAMVCSALGDLYKATNGSFWTNNTGWSTAAALIPTDYCNFYSVSCISGVLIQLCVRRN
jgi:hypothetical protein